MANGVSIYWFLVRLTAFLVIKSCVLIFDMAEGGGASGLSSLILFNEIMDRVKKAGGDDTVTGNFEVVAGTGTGA
jgi:hypothetical protein